MEYDYTPRGVCSRNIHVEVEDGIVKNVIFTGGCSGNTQGVAALAKGMKVDEVIERLKTSNVEQNQQVVQHCLQKVYKSMLNKCSFLFLSLNKMVGVMLIRSKKCSF